MFASASCQTSELFGCLVEEAHEVLQEAELSGQADSENDLGGSSETMYYIGLDVHKKTISYCVKDAAGCVRGEGKVDATRRELEPGSGRCQNPGDRYGSDHLHRLNLRSPASPCRTEEGGVPERL